jgi:ABC-type nitrate/sulfonate/bicarbonate transport system substrate-binding protein
MKKLLMLAVFILTASSAPASAPLKIGLLPIEDAVPFYVAEQEKMYAKENLQVELIPFQSALERDSALSAGAIDGAIDDPIGAILLDKGQGRLKITSICLGEKPAEGIFAILAAPGSGLKTVSDLKGVEIAVSNSTIIEYVTDRMLARQGFKAEEIKKIEVVKMPIRMQMLLSDAVKAATLPEPLASIAVKRAPGYWSMTQPAKKVFRRPSLSFAPRPLKIKDLRSPPSFVPTKVQCKRSTAIRKNSALSSLIKDGFRSFSQKRTPSPSFRCRLRSARPSLSRS